MVSVVGYDAAPGGGGGGGAGRTSSAPARAGGSSDYGYVTVDYGSIAGASAVPDSAPSGGYGGAPTGGYGGAATGGYGGGGYGGGYAQQQQQQQQQPAAGYGGGGYGQQQAAPAAAPDYGQQAGGYGSGNLMDAVTAPQVGLGGVGTRCMPAACKPQVPFAAATDAAQTRQDPPPRAAAHPIATLVSLCRLRSRLSRAAPGRCTTQVRYGDAGAGGKAACCLFLVLLPFAGRLLAALLTGCAPNPSCCLQRTASRTFTTRRPA